MGVDFFHSAFDSRPLFSQEIYLSFDMLYSRKKRVILRVILLIKIKERSLKNLVDLFLETLYGSQIFCLAFLDLLLLELGNILLTIIQFLLDLIMKVRQIEEASIEITFRIETSFPVPPSECSYRHPVIVEQPQTPTEQSCCFYSNKKRIG
jgi:hypothetical protein